MPRLRTCRAFSKRRRRRQRRLESRHRCQTCAAGRPKMRTLVPPLRVKSRRLLAWCGPNLIAPRARSLLSHRLVRMLSCWCNRGEASKALSTLLQGCLRLAMGSCRPLAARSSSPGSPAPCLRQAVSSCRRPPRRQHARVRRQRPTPGRRRARCCSIGLCPTAHGGRGPCTRCLTLRSHRVPRRGSLVCTLLCRSRRPSSSKRSSPTRRRHRPPRSRPLASTSQRVRGLPPKQRTRHRRPPRRRLLRRPPSPPRQPSPRAWWAATT